jgi:hypothetical protein
MLTMVLPQLVAGRDLADAMVNRLDGDIRGETVALDCRALVSGSPSFASQIVHRVLAEGDAHSLVVVGAPTRFAKYLADSANALAVGDRLDLTGNMPAKAASA